MSGTVGDNTARASGVIASAGGGGKILQVVNSYDTTYRSMTTSWSDLSSDLSCTITPTAASSKFLSIISLGVYNAGAGFAIALYSDIGGAGATNILPDTTWGFGWQMFWSSINQSWGHHWVDSPSTTSEIVYKVYYRGENTNVKLNRGYNSGSYPAMSTFTVMEIGA